MVQKAILLILWAFVGLILPFAICSIYINVFMYYNEFNIIYPIAAMLHFDLFGFLLYLFYREYQKKKYQAEFHTKNCLKN